MNRKTISELLDSQRKETDTREKPGLMSSIEKVTCALDVTNSLVHIETSLHGMKDSEEICQYVMKEICEFYKADFVGIMEVDLNMDSWFFRWWYRAGQEKMSQNQKWNLASDNEFTHNAPSWIKAYENNNMIVITDVEKVGTRNSQEYRLYQRLQARSVIGCPFYKFSTGFVVVKNPGRYIHQTAFLRLLTYVLMMELNEYKMKQSLKMQAQQYQLVSEKDVFINLFDGIQIITTSGTLEHGVFAPEEIEMLTFMCFREERRPIISRELESRVWEGYAGKDGQKVRHAVSGIRKHELVADGFHTLENVPGGYCFNPNLNIRIDVQEFLKLERKLVGITDLKVRKQILEDMVALYKGPIILTKDCPRWMTTYRHHMQNRYLKAVNQLLNIYFVSSDEEALHSCAVTCMKVIPNNVVGYYWKLRSYRKDGIREKEISLLENAEKCLPKEIYLRLKARLDRLDDENADEIYEADYNLIE